MTWNIGVSGAYKEVQGGTGGTGSAIGVGGAWKSIVGMWVGVGGVWKNFFDVIPVINTSASLNASRTASISTVYCGIQLNSDGTTLHTNASGSSAFDVTADPWLTSGLPQLVWVERSITSGSLNWVDSTGGGRVQMNANRQFGVSDAFADFSPQFCGFDLKFYDAASGGNLLGTIAAVSIQTDKT